MYFDLTKYQHNPKGDPDWWERFLRDFEVRNALNGFEKEHFSNGLELGCGSGKHSKYLAHFCKKLIALEFNEDRLIEQSNDKVTFVIGDAQDLSRFGDGEFDLVFSSNLIEHLSDLDRCLRECARVATDNGLIIHMVPNRTWKVFNLMLYYPFLIKTILCRVFLRREKCGAVASRNAELQFDVNLKPYEKRSLLCKLLPPKPHGISRSNWREFRNWGRRHWTEVFEKNGFEVVKIIRQPFYVGYEYNFRILLRLGNRLGLSACTGYFLIKTR
ncbi:MAG: class I SAM-dependent methyltransferase [Phycisphaerae bacterium]|jgi:SAM-dependent methyltransferase